MLLKRQKISFVYRWIFFRYSFLVLWTRWRWRDDENIIKIFPNKNVSKCGAMVVHSYWLRKNVIHVEYAMRINLCTSFFFFNTVHSVIENQRKPESLQSWFFACTEIISMSPGYRNRSWCSIYENFLNKIWFTITVAKFIFPFFPETISFA